jgi:hypothetical protein
LAPPELAKDRQPGFFGEQGDRVGMRQHLQAISDDMHCCTE